MEFDGKIFDGVHDLFVRCVQPMGIKTVLVDHFHSTIEALGGIKGIFLLLVAIILFQGIVHYSVVIGRKKRLAKKIK